MSHSSLDKLLQNMVNQMGGHSFNLEALMGKDFDELARVLTGALQKERPLVGAKLGPGAFPSKEGDRDPPAVTPLTGDLDLKFGKVQESNQKDTDRVKQTGVCEVVTFNSRHRPKIKRRFQNVPLSELSLALPDPVSGIREKPRFRAIRSHMCFLCLFPGQQVDGGGADKEPVDKVSAARLGCHQQIGFTENETFPILFSVHF